MAIMVSALTELVSLVCFMWSPILIQTIYGFISRMKNRSWSKLASLWPVRQMSSEDLHLHQSVILFNPEQSLFFHGEGPRETFFFRIFFRNLLHQACNFEWQIWKKETSSARISPWCYSWGWNAVDSSCQFGLAISFPKSLRYALREVA